jgi:hypothetical protein
MILIKDIYLRVIKYFPKFKKIDKKVKKTKTLNVMIKINIFVRCRGGSAG